MDRRHLTSGLTAALLLLSSGTASAEPNFGILQSELDAHCSDGRFSGAVAVVVAGAPVFQKACGKDVSTESRFKIFSTSKLLTALAVMALVEEGRMELDAPAARYLNGLPPAWSAVTVRQLLDHTSGLPDETNALLAAFQTDHGAAMHKVLADRQDAAAPATAPGSTWRYNNFGYELLADAAARVDGASFDKVLAKRVLEPAQMADALVELAVADGEGDPKSAPDPRLVAGYVRDEDGVSEAVSYSFVQLGAGAVHATAADFIALERALRDNRIVSAGTWREMVEQAHANAPAVPSARYGLGVMSVARAGLGLQGHTGGTNGYISSYRRIPSRDAMVVALSNFGWAEIKWIEEAVAIALANDKN